MENPEAVAVLIAAEGSLSLIKNNSGTSHPGYQARISVYNTDRALLEWVQDKTRMGNIPSPQDKKRWLPNAKPAYIWRVTDLRGVKQICEEILPYLPIKIKQCELILEFIELRQSKFKHWYTHDISYGEREKEIYEEMKILNKKGDAID